MTPRESILQALLAALQTVPGATVQREGVLPERVPAGDGGVVGARAPQRLMPAMALASAPRMHNGGFAGLRPDEVPAILQRGERVLS